ncbi:MAG TPA: hypothetical protein VMF30_19750 [Pirellulales bacterium]|nr:hypothetical protein [Pirellulales bacterium]
MNLLLADFGEHLWAWIGGAIGVVILIGFIMVLPDVMRYIRIKSM